MKTQKQVQEAIKAQKDLCLSNGWPHFAPRDGVCYKCQQQIYLILNGKGFITSCPYCHRSYCD